MPRAVIFDMDGLLVDSEPLWVRAEIEVFGEAGLVIDETDCTLTKGLRTDDVVAFWNARRPFASVADVEARLIARVASLVASEGRALPGIATALASASAHGPVVLASSSPTPIIEAALVRLGLSDAFAFALSAERLPYGKPHPAIFLEAAARLGVSPVDCLVLEDSLNGVLAAKSARMTCIAVPFDHPTHDPRFVIADAIVGSLEAVTPALVSGL